MKPYLPHPFGTEDGKRSDATQTAAWRARRDACRPLHEILAMSAVRRDRALAVREAARAMMRDPAATPSGQMAALRISIGVLPGGDPGDDWAERHRERERERMRRRRAAGDPKLAGERQRGREKERLPAARAKQAERNRALTAARKALKIAMEGQEQAARTAAMAALEDALAELKATAAALGLAPPTP